MEIYLPIAEISLDVFVLLALGGAVGFLSGVFGVGGGFLLTPLLIFIGVPPAAARPPPAPHPLRAPAGRGPPRPRRGHSPLHNGGPLLPRGLSRPPPPPFS